MSNSNRTFLLPPPKTASSYVGRAHAKGPFSDDEAEEKEREMEERRGGREKKSCGKVPESNQVQIFNVTFGSPQKQKSNYNSWTYQVNEAYGDCMCLLFHFLWNGGKTANFAHFFLSRRESPLSSREKKTYHNGEPVFPVFPGNKILRVGL